MEAFKCNNTWMICLIHLKQQHFLSFQKIKGERERERGVNKIIIYCSSLS